MFAGLLVERKLASRSHPPGIQKATIRLIVLPFESFGTADDARFAGEMTEEITSRLSTVPDLAVISSTTASHYDRRGKTVTQIGKALGVGYVVEGSVRWDRSGDGAEQVRITPELIRVSDDTHLWSEPMTANLGRPSPSKPTWPKTSFGC